MKYLYDATKTPPNPTDQNTRARQNELGQLEHLHSEDTPHRLMITHTIESYWIPSQKKTKSMLQI